MRFGCFSSSFNEAVKRRVKRVDSRMGEMRALIEAVSGTVKADEQVGAWSETHTGILPERQPILRRSPRLVVTHPSDR